MIEDYVNELFQIEHSELSRHLRHDLRGLYASLESALAETKGDPGGEVCKKLIAELKELLPQDTYSNSSKDQPVSRLKLEPLRKAVVDDKTLCTRLGDLHLISTEDSELWNEVQHLLLRISEPLAEEWHHKALKLAQEIGAEADDSQVIELPFDQDKLLYPGLTGTVEAKGLRLSTEAPLDERVAEGKLDGDLKLLAQVVSICLQFIEMDPYLHHCLKSVLRFRVTPLDSKQKAAYVKALIGRFRCLQKVEENGEPKASLRARLDLDEAIHSLVYLPPVETGSWWYNLQHAERKTLAQAVERVRQTGCPVTYQWLSGFYENVNKYTKDNLPLEDWRTPGDVSACLRIYARIDRDELPGRVLFRPLR
jgi:hypothetical protein